MTTPADDPRLADRIRGLVFGQAVGDALGLGTEFLSKDRVRELYPAGLRDFADIVRDTHRSRWTSGDWTDDTEQALCILSSLVDRRGIDERDIAARFQAWALADGMGMGETVASVLCQAAYPQDPAGVARRVWEESGRRSASNGAVMRTAILGAWQHADPARVEANAAAVCRLTHADPRCVASCVAVSLVAAAFLRGESELAAVLREAEARAATYDPGVRDAFLRSAGTLEDLDLDEGLADGERNRIGYTYTALEAALWAVRQATSFEDGVLRIVHEGGDADSNAAVAGALLGARDGFASIPTRWVAGLVRGDRLERELAGLLDLVAYGASTDAAIGTLDAYRYQRDAVLRRLAALPDAAAIVEDLARVLRYESEHLPPATERLRVRVAAPARRPEGRIALVSDIHGSLEGLEAALADIAAQRCDRIVCLGDLVEGGPRNVEVIAALRDRGIASVRGNHDEHNDAVLTTAERKYLQALPERLVEDDVVFVHISPRAKKRKVNHAVEAWNVFDECAFRLAFIGHVHVPMVFRQRSSSFGEAGRQAFGYNVPFALEPEERYVVSVGAIGYGRDEVGRIRYAIYDATAGTLELRAIDGPLLPLDYAQGSSAN